MLNMSAYSPSIQGILEPHETGQRLMPLAPREPLDGEGFGTVGSKLDRRSIFSDGSCLTRRC